MNAADETQTNTAKRRRQKKEQSNQLISAGVLSTERTPGPQKKNGRLVVARRPFPIGLSKGEALLPPFFSHLPPVGWSAASGGRGGALVRSPGRMAIPPGSSIRALRVRSGRGPTVRTALRGARSEWMKHATGFICLSRGDHQDRREPEPLVASAFSPDIPLEPARPAATVTRGPSTFPSKRVPLK